MEVYVIVKNFNFFNGAAYGKDQPTISEETLRDKNTYLTGEGLISPPRGKINHCDFLLTLVVTWHYKSLQIWFYVRTLTFMCHS